jgi:hypothetical protein
LIVHTDNFVISDVVAHYSNLTAAPSSLSEPMVWNGTFSYKTDFELADFSAQSFRRALNRFFKSESKARKYLTNLYSNAAYVYAAEDSINLLCASSTMFVSDFDKCASTSSFNEGGSTGSKDNDQLSSGTIAGIVLTVLFVSGTVCAFLWLRRRRAPRAKMIDLVTRLTAKPDV